jgi:hypothetical protein
MLVGRARRGAGSAQAPPASRAGVYFPGLNGRGGAERLCVALALEVLLLRHVVKQTVGSAHRHASVAVDIPGEADAGEELAPLIAVVAVAAGVL